MTRAMPEMFGRLMPHRRPVKWRYEPVNQLNDIEREYSRAGQDIRDAENKFDIVAGDSAAPGSTGRPDLW